MRNPEYIYFIEQGFISLLQSASDGRTVSVGFIGSEGIAPFTTFLGLPINETQWVVELDGFALRMKRSLFIRHRIDQPVVFRALSRYLELAFAQVLQTAACNALHSVLQRYSTWLLRATDAAQAYEFHLTQEAAATALGVRRASISDVAILLQGAGGARHSHGIVTIDDPAVLERSACGCHQAARARFQQLDLA
jgi:CRP-like cAMP-binding protein